MTELIAVISYMNYVLTVNNQYLGPQESGLHENAQLGHRPGEEFTVTPHSPPLIGQQVPRITPPSQLFANTC